MIEQLLQFVKDNNLSDIFNYNSHKGNLPFEIELRKFPNGKYAVFVNGNTDYDTGVEKIGISEEDAYYTCMQWLRFHLSVRTTSVAEETIEKLHHR